MALVIAIVAWSSLAFAESPEERARELFQSGRTLMEDKRYEEACQKFGESLEIYPSIGAQLNLGRCYEVTGRPASAFAAYKRAASMARRAGDGERADAAERFATDIEGKLSWIVIEANAGAPDLEVTLDGTRVAPGAYSTPLPVDPGAHRVAARAPGHTAWSESVMVGGKGESFTVRVPELGMQDVAAAPTSPPADEQEPGEGPDPLLVTGLVLAPLGAAGVVVGGVFGGLALRDRDRALDDPTLCPNRECTPAGRAVIDRAGTRAVVADVAIVIGAVALAGGVTMIIIASLDDGDPVGAELRVGPGGVSLHASF